MSDEQHSREPGVIDVHTHAFPDFLASRAVSFLEEKGKTKAFLDGSVAALLASMEKAGISHAVVCSIATEPHQFESILRWSKHITGGGIVPFPSVHPRSPGATEELSRVKEGGFSGIKLHPEYQDFYIDDPSLSDFYGAVEEAGLIILFHAGYDIGFPDSERSSPARIAEVAGSFPALRLVASHLGGFRQWEESGRHLVGGGVWLDTSYTLGHIDESLMREIIGAHRPDRLLFGSDSPWTDQGESLQGIRRLGLAGDLEKRILTDNARELLGL